MGIKAVVNNFLNRNGEHNIRYIFILSPLDSFMWDLAVLCPAFLKSIIFLKLTGGNRASTADFIKKVLSVYTHSMTTIYLSLSAQVAKSTFFMKSPVVK